MGRGKIEIRKIENPQSRQVTFSKRRNGLMKKAYELAVLCNAQVALVIFSTTGKHHHYSSTSITDILERYKQVTKTKLLDTEDERDAIEMQRLKYQHGEMQTTLRHFMGEGIGSLTVEELHPLESSLEDALYRVRRRKDELIGKRMEHLSKNIAKEEDIKHQLYRQLMLPAHNHSMEWRRQRQIQMQMQTRETSFRSSNHEPSSSCLHLPNLQTRYDSMS